MAPSSAVVSTLRRVTDTKLAKLAALQDSAATKHQQLLNEVREQSDPAERVRLLVTEVNRTVPQPPLWVKNVERFIDQSKHDPSVTPMMLQSWHDELLQILGWQSKRREHTALFSKLVTEWIENPNEVFSAPAADSDSEDASFEAIGREEMHQQRKQWEEYAFSKKTTDKDAIFTYLDSVFASATKSTRGRKVALEQLRESCAGWYNDTDLKIDGANSVKKCIRSVLQADLFAGEKRQALEDLTTQPSVLGEIADVLNADLASLDEWQWQPSTIALSMRRQLNGKYRVYMDEDIYQAILLQFVGIKFAVDFKTRFYTFLRSGVWSQKPQREMSRQDALRREYFLGPAPSGTSKPENCVRQARWRSLIDSYFMLQLPDSFDDEQRGYGDEDDSAQGDEDSGNDMFSRGTPMKMKQRLLYLATSESLLQREIYGSFTILQSDFKWFGPGMPHTTILAVLEYMHVPQKWLDFFKKFLTPSLYFAHDGKQGQVRQRTRGVPMSHKLSDALGEIVMFCLDFAINKTTDGGTLYRFHDDLWFWGQASSCEKAWKELNEFSTVMGMKLNEEKTGTAMLSKTGEPAPGLPKTLPRGPVRWGFLVLDASQGRWVIDDKSVDEHILELKRQLSACRSVFAYVQAFNAYVSKFFLNNLGWPADCLGREHIDACIATLERVQRQLYGEKGTITEYLRQTIQERFGVTDLPDAFFYFPEKLCGLNVANPMVTMLLKRSKAEKNPEKTFADCLASKEMYDVAKSEFDSGAVKDHSLAAQRAVGEDDQERFMSFEEYNRFPEERHTLVGIAYVGMQSALEPDTTMLLSPEITRARAYRELHSNMGRDWTLKWILELYGREVMKLCGDVQIGEREMLPLGLLGMLKAEKVRWQG